MDILKDAAIETIKKLPDGCKAEDIMYEIDFVAQVLEGLKDAESGNVLTTEELLNRVETWGNHDCYSWPTQYQYIRRHGMGTALSR